MNTVTKGTFSDFYFKDTSDLTSNNSAVVTYTYDNSLKIERTGQTRETWKLNDSTCPYFTFLADNVLEIDCTAFFTDPVIWSIQSSTNIAAYSFYSSSFDDDKISTKIEPAGGSVNISVTSETSWTAGDIADWITMSPTTGNAGTTTITFTAGEYSGPKRRQAVIILTNEIGDTCQIKVNQKSTVQTGQPLHLGSLEVPTIALGNKIIDAAYLGAFQVYSSGPFIGLKVKEKSIAFDIYNTTKELHIKSSEAWTVSSDVDWISFSQSSGDVGEYTITVSTPEYDTEATATITVTTASFSAVIPVHRYLIHYVSYIHTPTLKPNSAAPEDVIDSGIIPTPDTKFSIKAMYKGNIQGNMWLGYKDNDSADYRVIYDGSVLYFDFNRSRISARMNYPTGQIIDITGENYRLIDNTTGTVLMSGNSETTINDPHTLKLDVSSWWLQQVQVWNGTSLIFDGEAAEMNGVVGLYDRVTETMFTNRGSTLTYEE